MTNDINLYNGWSIPSKEEHFQQWLLPDITTNYQEKPFNLSIGYCKKFNLAIDIGANIGMMTRRYSGLFDKVIAFEPVDINYKCLVRNVKDLDNVTTYDIGIGNEEKIIDIHNDEDYVNSGGWSIVDFNNDEWQHYNKDIKLLSQSITVKSLDSYNLKPDYIKIDTQNYELEVLKGAEKTIREYKPIIQLEVEKMKTREVLEHAVTKLMKEFDYNPIKIIKKDWIFGSKDDWNYRIIDTSTVNRKEKNIKKRIKKHTSKSEELADIT